MWSADTCWHVYIAPSGMRIGQLNNLMPRLEWFLSEKKNVYMWRLALLLAFKWPARANVVWNPWQEGSESYPPHTTSHLCNTNITMTTPDAQFKPVFFCVTKKCTESSKVISNDSGKKYGRECGRCFVRGQWEHFLGYIFAYKTTPFLRIDTLWSSTEGSLINFDTWKQQGIGHFICQVEFQEPWVM